MHHTRVWLIMTISDLWFPIRNGNIESCDQLQKTDFLGSRDYSSPDLFSLPPNTLFYYSHLLTLMR